MAAARRRRISLATLAPWRRAPLLLRDQPAVLLALAAAAAVLAMASSSAPLFLGTTGSAALARAVDSGCAERALPAVDNPAVQYERYFPLDRWEVTADEVAAGDRVVRAAMATAGLPAPTEVVLSDASLSAGSGRPVPVTLFARPEALAHTDILAGARSGRGAWITDRFAGQQGLGVGDELRLGAGTVPIAGIYRDLGGNGFEDILPDYWCTWRGLLVPSLENRPPPFVIVDQQTLLNNSSHLVVTWYSPVDTAALSIPVARTVLDRTGQLEAALVDAGLVIPKPGYFSYVVHTDLGQYADRAAALSAGVRGPVIPVAVAGTVVALLFVAGAGAFWAVRRRPELDLLVSRGVGPAAVGGKAALEVLPPVLVGSLLGWAATLLLVRLLGPSPLLEPGAIPVSLAIVGAAAAIALLLLGVVAARRGAAGADARRPPWLRWVTRVPWELALVAAAVVLSLRGRQATTGALTGIAQVDPGQIAFPLLALSGVLLFVARLLTLLLPALGTATRGAPAALYLAARRLRANAFVTAAVVVLVAVPVGVFVYADVVTSTADHNLQVKAQTYAGSANSLNVGVPPAATADVDGHGTPVSVITDGSWTGGDIEVLGIDPDTFAQFADDIVDGSLADLVAPLQTTEGSGAVPAILVSPRPERAVPTEVQLRMSTLPVDVVQTVPVFPGLRLVLTPALVVDRAALSTVDRYTQREEEIWTTDAQLPAALAALERDGITVQGVRSPETLLDATDLVTVTWSFGYLRALAVLTGLIAVCGLFLFLGVRARARAAAYVLSRRMGLSRATHIRSLAVELGAILLLAWLSGLGVTAAALSLAGRHLDVDPEFPPPPALQLPLSAAAGSAAVVVVIAVIATAVAQRSADRTAPATVLRLGG